MGGQGEGSGGQSTRGQGGRQCHAEERTRATVWWGGVWEKNEGKPLPMTHKGKRAVPKEGLTFSSPKPAKAGTPEFSGHWPAKSGPDCQDLIFKGRGTFEHAWI
jgi:hypothetical protein